MCSVLVVPALVIFLSPLHHVACTHEGEYGTAAHQHSAAVAVTHDASSHSSLQPGAMITPSAVHQSYGIADALIFLVLLLFTILLYHSECNRCNKHQIPTT